MQSDGVLGEIAYLDIEDLVHQIGVESGQAGLLENQLTVDDQGEQVTDDEQEVEVAHLVCVRSGGRQQLLERTGLLVEERHVRYVQMIFVNRCPVGELHLGCAPSGTLCPEEHVV